MERMAGYASKPDRAILSKPTTTGVHMAGDLTGSAATVLF